jgi:hypothetical protein
MGAFIFILAFGKAPCPCLCVCVGGRKEGGGSDRGYGEGGEKPCGRSYVPRGTKGGVKARRARGDWRDRVVRRHVGGGGVLRHFSPTSYYPRVSDKLVRLELLWV